MEIAELRMEASCCLLNAVNPLLANALSVQYCGALFEQ